MTGNSPLSAIKEQRASLIVFAGSRDRDEADRAVLPTPIQTTATKPSTEPSAD